MTRAADLAIRIFADAADLAEIARLSHHPLVRGFTTNPTLMRKAGVSDYEAFAREAVSLVGDRPISFEVLADDLDEMEAQARAIARWGDAINIKIPVTNTRGVFTGPVVRALTDDGIKVNVTAVFTLEQVRAVVPCLRPDVPSMVSIFAGRIADSGCDPVPVVAETVRLLSGLPAARVIWASPREVLNAVQADHAGCQIITMTADLLAKLELLGKDPTEFSRETVAMFYRDAVAAGYRIKT
jgi:transaldolase